MNLARLFLSGAVLAYSTSLLAMDYHVSPKGNDANAGTVDAPWKSIEQVNKTSLHPGDRVLFESGQTFVGPLVLDAHDSGADGKPVVITSYGEKRAVIDGGKGTGLSADGCNLLHVERVDFIGAGRKNGNDGCGIRIANAEGCVVSEVDVQGFRLAGVDVAGLRHARIEQINAHDNGATGINVGDEKNWSEDVYVGHCTTDNNPGDPKNLDNHSGSGIVVGGVRGCLVEYCEASNNGWDMPREGNGPVGIWAWNADRVIIQFCISHDNKSPSWDGGGFDLDGGVTNSILQYNLSYNNNGPGYFFCQYYPAPIWKNNIVRYNISQNDGRKKGNGGGFSVGWYELMSDGEVYNNVFYNADGPAVVLGNKKAPGMRFRNNIIVSGTELISGSASNGEFTGNVYWMLDGKPFKVDGYDSLEAWSKATGQERIGENMVGQWADPKLIQPGKMGITNPNELAAMIQYQIEKDSPCVGAGMAIGENGGRDFWGNAVPNGENPTVGAHQR